MQNISLCPRRNSTIFSGGVVGQEIEDHDHLYNLIMTRQADRLDDQRSELGGRPRSCSALPMELPDDVTDLVIAMQAGRYESQRAHLKVSFLKEFTIVRQL